MLRANRWLMVLVAVFVAMTPLAEASVVLLPDPCPMMAKAAATHASHSCCGAACDCSIQQQTEPFSSDIPVQKPEFKLSALAMGPDTYSGLLVSPRMPETIFTEESPPQETPLYQEYSDYRL